MSRRCSLAHNDAARAIVHDGLMHGHSVDVIARSVNHHRISKSAVRRYFRRYSHELSRLELMSAGGGLVSAHPDSTNSEAGFDHGSLVSGAELNTMLDLLVEGLGVLAKRDVASKEARFRADPAAHIKKQEFRGLSRPMVEAIKRQVLGLGD